MRRGATPYRNVAMDYSFYVNQTARWRSRRRPSPRSRSRPTRATSTPSTRPTWEARAPLNIGHHFTTWNHGAYLRALTHLLDGVCGLPEVRCVSLVELADWLDAQPPERLASMSRGDSPPRHRRP